MLSLLDSCKSMIAIIAMQIAGHRVVSGKETLRSVHPKFMQKQTFSVLQSPIQNRE